jgi:hypothetical protein
VGAKVREKLSVSKQAAQIFYVERLPQELREIKVRK